MPKRCGSAVMGQRLFKVCWRSMRLAVPDTQVEVRIPMPLVRGQAQVVQCGFYVDGTALAL